MQNDLKIVLEDMRGAIVGGNYERLADLLPALSEAEKTIALLGMGDLAALRRTAAQNAACLDAAISGIKSARRRLAEIAKAEKGLTTYDREGAKATLSATPPKSRRV